MLPGGVAPPGDEMGRAFMAAVFAALESKCECESCGILRVAARQMRAALLAGR